METIVGISTPIGNGAIGIVRMSGAEALQVAFDFFHAKNLTTENIKPRYLYLGDFISEKVKDKCLMVFFKAPNSFTGENLIEFQVHGGRYLCEEIIKQLLTKNNIRLAENGEFSKLAFMNGKLSLDKAEGIVDLIEAESDEEIKAGYNLVKGYLFQEINKIQNDLTVSIANLEMTIDYPEHDEETFVKNDVKSKLDIMLKSINSLLENCNYGQMIKNGVTVAIVGKTNVGKSSLLNSIVGEDRAIVTDIEGTTRDVVSQWLTYKGIKFNFIDTAGIRESQDVVEKIGIEKAINIIDTSDIILFVIDASQGLTDEDKKIYKKIQNKKHIVVYNKVDVKSKDFETDINAVEISCVKKQGIKNLMEKIYEKCVFVNSSKIVLSNQRHIKCLKNTKKLIKELDNLDFLSTDIISFELKRIWGELGKITGVSENEKIIDEIFARFCLGK